MQEELHRLAREGKIIASVHAYMRLWERKIGIAEVKAAILNGVIIESYPHALPNPRYLILHATDNPLHVVCAREPEQLCIVTAYRPDSSDWYPDNRTRRTKR